MTTTDIIRLLRPHQWVKNGFVLLPAFFSGNIADRSTIIGSMIALAAFCLASSAVYCLNDVRDAEADRTHPKKRMRPIASGAVSPSAAIAIMVLLFATALTMTLTLLPSPHNVAATVILAGYVVMNIAYCLRLKHLTLVDVFIISVGFVLRVAMGGAATGIFISHWLILMTFLLALFLALSKRRDDLIIYRNTGVKPRRNIHRYNLDFMSQSTTLVSTTMLVCYIMYTVSAEVIERMHSSMVYITTVFVLAGLLRYIQLTVVDVKSGSPTRILLHDRFIYCCVGGWLITFFIIIYL